MEMAILRASIGQPPFVEYANDSINHELALRRKLTWPATQR